MGFLFNRRPEMTGIEDIDALQYGDSDPRSEALAFVDSIQAELEVGVHPWHGSDQNLLRLALAGVAVAQDRTAEIVLAAGTVQTKDGPRVTWDVYNFTEELSRTAGQRLATARAIDPNDPNILFGPQTVADLQPESMMPYWPSYPVGSRREAASWQVHPDGELEAEVTVPFILGIVAAAKELEADADHNLRALTVGRADLPAQYANIYDDVTTYLFSPAGDNLRKVDLESATLLGLNDAGRAEALDSAHDAFIGMMSAYVGSFAPYTLGAAYEPVR